MAFPPNRILLRRRGPTLTKENHMGDRSPKDHQKKSSQKQAKNNDVNRLKQQAAAAKRVPPKK